MYDLFDDIQVSDKELGRKMEDKFCFVSLTIRRKPLFRIDM